MKIEVMDDGVRAYIRFSCGHVIPMYFAAEEYAEYHRADYEARVCVNCIPFRMTLTHEKTI